MPFVNTTDAAEFRIPGVVFSGLASPSRGATETTVWRVTLDPRNTGGTHQLTREEIIVATNGSAVATLNGVEYALVVGSAIIVPPNVDFSLSNPHDVSFEAIAVLPIGGQARIGGGTAFTPPWAE